MKNISHFERRHNSKIDELFHQLNLGNTGNTIYWWKFFEKIKTVRGDIVECGIGRARSLMIICAINFLLDKKEGGGRRVYGYDSFAGFPEPTIEDESFRNPQKGEWSCSPSGKYKYSSKFIKQVLKSADIPLGSRLILRKGFFNKSLLDHPDRPIALLHIDGDLYQSYKDVLEILFDRVSKKGIIVFDDFAVGAKKDPFPGAKLAVKNFLGTEFNKLQQSIAGKYFYVKK